MTKEIAKALPEQHGDVAKSLMQLIDRYGPSALATADDISRAFLVAEGVKAVRAVVKRSAAILMELQGSSLGFRTDKDASGGYPEAVVVECATEALLRGVRLTGNEFNIISGRCYLTQAGCAHLVGSYQGLTDLEHAPSVPVVQQGGAVVEYTVRWRLNGTPMSLTRLIPVRTSGTMSMDAILGKAKRKALAAVFERLTGSVLSEGDADDVVPMQQTKPLQPVERPLKVVYAARIIAAPDMATLRAVVDDLNNDVKSKRFTADENAELKAMVASRKAELTAASSPPQSESLSAPSQEGEQSADPTATPPVPDAGSSSAPARPAPATSRTDSGDDLPAGGDIVRRIVELLGKPTNIDWTQVRDDKLDDDLRPSEEGGIAEYCGFYPAPHLKVTGLTAKAATRLYWLLKRVADRKAAERARRSNKAEAMEA